MSERLPRVMKVRALPGYRLELKFRGEKEPRIVDVSGFLRTGPLKRLRDEARFAEVEVTDWGAAADWPGGLDLGASALWQAKAGQKPGE